MKKLLIEKGLVILFIILACSKDTDVERIVDSDPIVEEEPFNYTSSSKYNLNIIYFMPKGKSERIDSHRRLSEILLQGQEFYKQQMKANGFGDKTFNLLVDNKKNRVKIDYLIGNHGASHYPYEGGANNMIPEIEAYYAKNPEKNNSDHYLVLSPVIDPRNSDVPYYGVGKWCFASDFNEMDIKYLGSNSEHSGNATLFIGGLLHELGHGLNLPHNKEKVSDLSKDNKGTALMGAGNQTYGSHPTFLTMASCAILNNNQIFSSSNEAFYTGATATVENLQGIYENGNIKLSGTVNSDVQVNYISIYNDPADDNADYDAVTWATPVGGDNNFSVDMPINELHKKGNTEYILRLRLNHTSGDITSLSYFYQFVSDTPVIQFGEKDYLDRTNWTIESYSSQEDSDAQAVSILDGDPSTKWHSRWRTDAPSYPHSIAVNMGENTEIEGFSFLQHSGRRIKDIELFVSDDNATWTSKGSYELKDINTIQHIYLPGSCTTKYFRIEAKSSHDGEQFAALAEVMCY